MRVSNQFKVHSCTPNNPTTHRLSDKPSVGYFWGYDFAVTESAGQPRRGRKPLPPGMAKVKRNLRLGKIYDEIEAWLAPGETMTHLIEALLERELLRRKRAEKKKAPPA